MGIIDQLNKTKKLFIIMLLTIMIIPPIAFMLSFSNRGSPFPFDNRNETSDEKLWTQNQFLLLNFSPPDTYNNCCVVRHRNQTMVWTLEMGYEI